MEGVFQPVVVPLLFDAVLAVIVVVKVYSCVVSSLSHILSLV